MKVFIIGAGTLGSTAAYLLAERAMADEIVLYDDYAPLAEHHAEDISQAVCAVGGVPVCAGGMGDMWGADIVVSACGLMQREYHNEIAADTAAVAPLVRRMAGDIARFAPEALVVSLTNPLDTANYLLCRYSGLPRARFMGFSANDTLRFRDTVAEYLGVSYGDIEAWTVGEHGRSKVNLYSSVRVRGAKPDFVPEDCERIEKRVGERWMNFLGLGIQRTAGWTTCANLVAFIETLLGKRAGPVQCSCVLDGELGLTGLSIGLPARVGAGGVEKLLPPDMGPEEQNRFLASAETIRAAIAAVI